MTAIHDVTSTEPSGTAPSELNLIRFSQSGDREAFACLYETNLDRIRRYNSQNGSTVSLIILSSIITAPGKLSFRSRMWTC
jgi:hypothetical protein